MNSFRRFSSPWVLVLAAVVLFESCPSKLREGPNVVFIAVDTLRADRLGCYGNPRGLTPNIDQLAASGARFADCSSHAPWTLPSFASLFTSSYPPEHGAGGHLGDFRALPKSAKTFASAFRDAGYSTAAVTNVDFLGPEFGLLEGFDHTDSQFYESNDQMRRANDTTDAALTWLRVAPKRPFLLFVHYFDAHASYDPPPEWRKRFALPEDQSSTWTFGSREDFINFRYGKTNLDAHTIERAAALYDAEVAFVDAEIGRLLAGVAQITGASETIVVLTADHGEEFLDHGSWEHGHSLHQELIHVPLIVSDPARVPKKSVDALVRHIDVAPTLFELADIPHDRSFRGQSLMPLLEHGAKGPEFSYAEGDFLGRTHIALRHGALKYLYSDDRGAELYDLGPDPREGADRAASDPTTVERLSGELQLLRTAFDLRQGRAVEPTEAVRQRLRALGYADVGAGRK